MTFQEQLITFMFLFCFPLLNASEAKRCSSSSCESTNVDVRFPFLLFPKQSSTCGHTGFNHLCTETALKLPNTELFLVRDIDYENQRIRLNYPKNCLARRFLSINASGSPLSPLHYLNHTTLTCPKNGIKSSSRYIPIPCLGNSTSSFFATRFDLASSMPSSCQIVKTLLLPASSSVAVDLNDQDLWLKWDLPSGRDCETNSSLRGFKNNTTLEVKWFSSFISGLHNFVVLIMKLICLSLMTLLFGITTCVVYVTFSFEWLPTQIRRSVARNATRKPPRGRARSAIVGAYKKVITEKNMKLPGKNDNICPICLSEYESSETVGCLFRCEHCFHARRMHQYLVTVV